MPPKVVVPQEVKTIEQIDTSACTHPAGHCFGSDGGSGVPPDKKVPPGRGGEVEVWTLDAKKETIVKKEIYLICQYCEKATYKEDKKD